MITKLFEINGIPMPQAVLAQILGRVNDPKVAAVCHAFQQVINDEDFWKSVAYDLTQCGIQVTVNPILGETFKEKVEILFKTQTAKMKELHPAFVGVQKEQPLNVDYYVKLEQFMQLHSKCKEYHEDFKLSSHFDTGFGDQLQFSDQQAHSVDYCNQYMKNYIAFVESELHAAFYTTCQAFEPGFTLSGKSVTDANNFDGSQTSDSYAIQYMASYLVNMYDISSLIVCRTWIQTKKELEKAKQI